MTPNAPTAGGISISEDRPHLRRMGVALWGACLGWLLSMACLALVLRSYHPRAGHLPDILPECVGYYSAGNGVEVPERFFFGIWFLLGGAAAYLAARFLPQTRFDSRFLGVALLLFVPAAAVCMTRLFARQGARNWFLLTAACLLLPPLLGMVVTWLRHRVRAVGLPGSTSAEFAPKAENGRTSWGWGLCADLAVWGLLALALCPRSVPEAAAQIGTNPHPVSFIVGPALYGYGDHLVPGKDFLSQYGVGQGHLFSYLVGRDAKATVEHFVRLMAGLCWIFFGLSYHVLGRFLGSRLWAFGTMAAALLLTFHGSAAFIDPSSWPTHFPLLFVFAWLVVRSLAVPEARARRLPIGLCVGLSIFVNTETGICMMVVAALAAAILPGFGRTALLRSTGIVAVSLATFVGLSLLAFGPGIFSISFFYDGWLKPLFIYGSGFGGVPINWAPGWNYAYAVVCPLVLVASVAWCVSGVGRNQPRSVPEAEAYLFVLALLGISFLPKWINRSLDGVWLVNAYPILAVMAWWLQRGYRAAFAGNRRSVPTRLAGGLLLGAIVAGLWFVDDPRNPGLYGFKAYWQYPSLAKDLLTLKRLPRATGTNIHVPAADVDLIRKLTGPRERVALYSTCDWVYLATAHRAPRFHFLQSTQTFLQSQVDRSLSGVDLIFVNPDNLRQPVSIDNTLGARMSALLQEDYHVEAVGATLVAYRKKARPQFTQNK